MTQPKESASHPLFARTTLGSYARLGQPEKFYTIAAELAGVLAPGSSCICMFWGPDRQGREMEIGGLL